MNEMTDAEALIMAAECPLIRAAYASEDAEVIKRTEELHPPSRCEYVKQAADEKRMFEKERGK